MSGWPDDWTGTVRLRATAENMNDGVLYPRNRKTFDEDIARGPHGSS